MKYIMLFTSEDFSIFLFNLKHFVNKTLYSQTVETFFCAFKCSKISVSDAFGFNILT